MKLHILFDYFLHIGNGGFSTSFINKFFLYALAISNINLDSSISFGRFQHFPIVSILLKTDCNHLSIQIEINKLYTMSHPHVILILTILLGLTQVKQRIFGSAASYIFSNLLFLCKFTFKFL